MSARWTGLGLACPCSLGQTWLMDGVRYEYLLCVASSQSPVHVCMCIKNMLLCGSLFSRFLLQHDRRTGPCAGTVSRFGFMMDIGCEAGGLVKAHLASSPLVLKSGKGVTMSDPTVRSGTVCFRSSWTVEYDVDYAGNMSGVVSDESGLSLLVFVCLGAVWVGSLMMMFVWHIAVLVTCGTAHVRDTVESHGCDWKTSGIGTMSVMNAVIAHFLEQMLCSRNSVKHQRHVYKGITVRANVVFNSIQTAYSNSSTMATTGVSAKYEVTPAVGEAIRSGGAPRFLCLRCLVSWSSFSSWDFPPMW